MQEEQRYLVTGVHNKRNFEKVPYEFLKKCNYKSLVNEYHKSKEKSIFWYDKQFLFYLQDYLQ